MRRRIQISLCLSLAVMLSGVEASFAQVNSDSLISVYKKKMQKYLDKESFAANYFRLDKQGIRIFTGAESSENDTAEYSLPWNRLGEIQGITPGGIPEPAMPNEKKPLLNYKIALDPGHIAGDLVTGKMEKKWVEMKSPPGQVIEGELTLATALILRKKLEALGAKVMLTREQPNISAFDMDFKTWKDSLFVKAVHTAYERGDLSFEEKSYLLAKANDTEIFRRFFLLEDLRERARKINEFNPDLTLVIHYNVDETNTNWNRPTRKNFNMTFVGGSFTADELDKPEARLEFLRLLLTDDIERSIVFSKFIIEGLVEMTKVPAALDSNAVYLKDNCMNTEVKGVYCRNLTLTRKVKGVICYGESLYQDNIYEYRALIKKDASTPISVTNGIQTSKRVEDVAEAYFQGIMNYMKR